MPLIVTESVLDLTDPGVKPTITFILDPEPGTLANRLRVVVDVPVERDDGRGGRTESIRYAVRDNGSVVPDDAFGLPNLAAGESATLRQILNKIWLAAKAAVEAP